jgi:hypothetical protein
LKTGRVTGPHALPRARTLGLILSHARRRPAQSGLETPEAAFRLSGSIEFNFLSGTLSLPGGAEQGTYGAQSVVLRDILFH